MNQLVELFKEVQKIPYKCRAENSSELNKLIYANCSQKRGLLKQRLDAFEFESRYINAIFNWNNLPIPKDILEILKNSGTLQKHHLLEVKIEGNYFKVDPTWNLELGSLGFPVTKYWNGNSDTEQITKGAIFFYDPLIQQICLPYFPEERIKFAKEFNKWLGWKL